MAFSGTLARAQTPQLFGSTGLDPSFCQQKTFRQTVVYVDNLSVQQGQTSWAVNLEAKLRATLTPGERVTVVELSPTNGSSQEIWSGCYPDYSAEAKAELAKKTYFFSSNPLNSLKTQQGFFLNAFGSAITQVFEDSSKVNHPSTVDANQPPQEEIVEALASDGARFSQSPETVRAIVFSDLAQHSSLGTVFNSSSPAPTDAGQKLGTYFRHSVFYFFGVGTGVINDGTYLADARTFWVSVMSSMDAPVDGLGSDLNVPNEIPTQSSQYVLSVTVNGDQLFGRGSFLTDADGNLIDSWLGVNRLTFVGISGTFICSSAASPACTVNATTNGGLTTQSSSEELSLTGNDNTSLKGTIGVQGALEFPVTAKLQIQ
jgi:hypothetical protein